MIVRILLLFIALFTFGAQAQAIKESYAFAVLGEPRYAFNFNHFDYVNPAAPKGGQITLSALGTFDNFNRYALRGNPGARTEQLYDTLFTTSDDEPGSYYPLIAESARYADDYSWVEVAINPRARFHDGSPITARDVEFTFQKFMTEGVPQFRLVYKGTTVKAIAPLTVRIELAKPGKEDMLSLFSLPVFPEKYWKDHKLSRPARHASACQWSVPHYVLENGAKYCLFPRERLLGSKLTGKPWTLEFRHHSLRLLPR